MSIGNLKDNENDEKEKENKAESNNRIDIKKDIGNESEDNMPEPKKIEVKEEYIDINADKVTLLLYTFTIFVIITIIFYFIGLPLSIIFLKNIWKLKEYKD